MIRKLVMILALAILAGARLQGQQDQPQPSQPQQGEATQTPANQTSATQAPATQAPANQNAGNQQSSSSQEASEEETARQKRARANDYRKWAFNVGGGANLARGTTSTFVKGGGGLVGVGAARNLSKYFGFRLDFQWVDLPLRASALQLAQAPTGSNHVYALTLDPIVNIPVTRQYTGYFLIGPNFLHRSGKLESSTAVPGTACNVFYQWWGTCYVNSLPVNKHFLAESQNEFGYNFGGGVARKVRKDIEIYGEFRQVHGSRSNISTDWRSLTIGVRW